MVRVIARPVLITLAAMLFCVAPLHSGAAGLPESGTAGDPLDPMEHTPSGRVLMEFLSRIDTLQHEIRELRGQVEIQDHVVSKIKQAQQDRYPDFDARLRRLETAAGFEPLSAGTGSPGISSGQGPSAPGMTGAGSSRPPKQKAPGQSGGSPSFQSTGAVSRAPGTGVSGGADPGQEQQAYRNAFGLLEKGTYESAIKALGTFLEQYPGSQYAGSARYWLGEAYYVTQQYQAALVEFREFLRDYPSNTNITDALLKVGYTQQELGREAEARQTLDDLIERYPGTPEARFAKDRLRKIKAASSN